jgi:gamma-glutamyltranspeptidase
MGNVQAIMWKDDLFYGVSDPRLPGAGTLAVH